MNIDELITMANKSSLGKNYDEAVNFCETVLNIEPDNVKALRIKSFCYSSMGNVADALDITNILINTIKTNEPCDYLSRARFLLKQLNAENIKAACDDLLKILELSEKYNSIYYVSVTELHLAYCYALLANKSEAQYYLDRLTDESITYVGEKRVTKKSIAEMLSKL